ncbi:hypothetical protein [Nonomuraea typhae]|uniref:Uncharacterized protein n=1 Tax=Nonomuraea typhae TaxID=2603600 RepID=A0ABW7ZCE1_9ACTN
MANLQIGVALWRKRHTAPTWEGTPAADNVGSNGVPTLIYNVEYLCAGLGDYDYIITGFHYMRPPPGCQPPSAVGQTTSAAVNLPC